MPKIIFNDVLKHNMCVDYILFYQFKLFSSYQNLESVQLNIFLIHVR